MAARRVPAKVLRLLDANLNRCREGLRVLEDTARFMWEDGELFESFRRERHALDVVTRKLYPELVASRNSERDRGRGVAEGGRERFESVVAANLRRCEESLRVLEEYGKLFSARAGARFKKIRFKMYDLEKRALARSLKP